MKEDLIREAVRTAIKEMVKPEEKKEERLTPEDKEHLTENKINLNKELMRKWNLNKKGKGKLLNESK